MDALIKLAISNPITAIIIIGITAASSKYAWSYWTKRDINLTNYKIAELDFKQQIDSAFVAINNNKKDLDDHDDEIDLLQKRLNTIDVNQEDFKDKLSEIQTDISKMKLEIEDLKSLEAKIKRLEKKFKEDKTEHPTKDK
jgi:predicted RNase H-like nuclease (RuvC/YqgF family)